MVPFDREAAIEWPRPSTLARDDDRLTERDP